MADHFSGPRSISDPASDIADVYAFPSPERPGNLVLVLNTFPAAAPTALFSDAITYRFRVRPVAPGSESAAAAFTVGEDEYSFDFTFDAPRSSAARTPRCRWARAGRPAAVRSPSRSATRCPPRQRD